MKARLSSIFVALVLASHCAGDTLPGNAASIRSIILPHFESDMPDAPGREEFMRVCVACHSPRYVTMQPPFAQAQWTETVNKMIKTYGAPADEKQAPAIVNYLVAIHGIEPVKKARASSYDDDSDESGNLRLPQPAETFPTLNVALDADEHAKQVGRGAALFRQDCAGCHGAKGGGNEIVGQVLLPKPVNLTAAEFNLSSLGHALWNGVRGTAMPSWRNLPQSDLNGLAAYVQTLHPPAAPDQAPPEILAVGRALFHKDCAACHGELGDGKSAVAATLSPPPANLHWMQPDFGYVVEVLRDGVPGTSMPSWKEQISESDRKALAAFVRSLYEPAKSDERK
jgi:mono/diheme cytochrome c family protein